MSVDPKSEKALFNHLTTWLREEIQAQRLRLDTLHNLRASMSEREPSRCERLIQMVQTQEKDAHSREARCQALFSRFAELWDLPEGSCTLRTVAVKFPEESAAILEQRAELQTLVQGIALEGKRVSATARMHRALVLDVLNAIFEPTSGDPLEEQGHLLDAEA